MSGLGDVLRALYRQLKPAARKNPGVDIARWSGLENNEDWNERARVIHPFLQDHLPVLDVGSGTTFLKNLVGAASYISVDSVATHGADHVVDLNAERLPPVALSQARAVTFLGVLEYLADPEQHLADALRDERRVIATYTPTDFVSDIATRAHNGWQSHLSLDDMQAIFHRLTGRHVHPRKLGNQVFWVLGGRESPQMETADPASRPALVRKRKIVLSGFFARGNAGDEALLQRIYETISGHVDVVLTVDRTGAYEAFWDWYPYKGLEIIHQGELARILEPDILGIHVGGGGLPLGFNGGQNAIARAVGRTLVSSGIDDPRRILSGHAVRDDALTEYLSSFKRFDVRTVASYEEIKGLSETVHLGADWASDLAPDDSNEPFFDGFTVVLRELPQTALDTQRLGEYAAIFKMFEKLDIPIRLLPFCPEDERYIDWIDSAWPYKIERHWWNPRRCKELIAKSRGLVSIGRLHPLIFAADSGTPALAVDIDTQRFTTLSPTSKIRDHAEEFAIPYFASMGALLEHVASSGEVPMNSHLPDAYRTRLASMKRGVIDAFGL